MSVRPTSVLLADLGGTHVRFALADASAESPLDAASIRRYRVADFDRFEESARHYLDDVQARPQRAVFAVAGPVTGDAVRMINHSWVLTGEELRRALGLSALRLVNDFAAMSHCLPLLGGDHLHRLGAPPLPEVGAGQRQTFAVIGPGTGLGVGALRIDDGRCIGIETEGGHVGFAPGDAVELRVLERLLGRFERVSAERLLCGSGLVNLHAALHDLDPAAWTPEAITAAAEAGNAAAGATLERFAGMLGSLCGDYVLALGAWDGVFLPGGLMPTLLPWLERGGFRRRFDAKGRYADLLARVPVAAILHPDPGLLGAAMLARIDAEKARGYARDGAHA